MSRFFAFGCSFTASHDRPTWADIIGREFDFYQNYARGGMSNQYIFNQLIECHARHKLTSDDTVIIMWTSVTREDRYVKDLGGWYGKGNIYYSDDHSSEWIKKFACTRGYLIRDLAVISAARDLLKYWGVKYKFLAMVPVGIAESTDTLDPENQDIFNLYQDIIDEIKPSVYEVIFKSQDWQLKKSNYAPMNNGQRDPHPDPKESLEYIQTVLPEIALSESTINYVNNFKYGDTAPQHYLIERL
jgi:hypothetical protein